MSIKTVIHSLDFFSTLNDKEIELLVSISTLQNYHESYVLHYEKNESDKLLFLTQGLAKAYKIDKHSNEIFLYYIQSNTLVSEVSDLQNNTLFSFSNISMLEDSQVLSIDYVLFKKYFLNQQLLNIAFVNELLLRSKKMESLINREFIFDSVAKVSMMLSSDLAMFNRLKRNDISLILNIQPATLSRVLNRLKRNKIISIEHGKISILEMELLTEIYQEL